MSIENDSIEISFTNLAMVRGDFDISEMQETLTWGEYRELFFDPVEADGKDAPAYIPGTFIDKPVLSKRAENHKSVRVITKSLPPVHSVEELGVTAYYPDKDTAVDKVQPGSPFEKIGVKNGARIKAVNGEPVSNWEEIQDKILNSTKSRPEITYWQNAGTYRVDRNIDKLYCISIDADKDGAYDEILKFLKDKGVEFVAHSTFSYSSENTSRMRFVVPLANPILNEDVAISFTILTSLMPMDESCSNPSRAYYFPTINKDSDLDPYAFHNEGKLLTKEMIFDWGYDNGIDISQDLNRAVAHNTQPAKKRIGLGMKEYSQFGSVAPPGLKYSDFVKRHQERIDNLNVSDSRNTFARDVIWHEILKFGEKADLEKLVYFMYEVSKHTGSTPIGVGASDTHTEIPGLIQGAMDKMMESKPHGLHSLHKDIIAESTAWTIKASKLLPSSHGLLDQFEPEPVKKKHVKYDYQTIKSRNSSLIESVNSGEISDWDFLKKVIFKEIEASPDKLANLKQITEFVYRFSKEELSQDGNTDNLIISRKKKELPSALGGYVKKVLAHCHPELAAKFTNVDKMTEKMAKEAENRMNNNKWLEPEKKSLSEDSQP